MAEWVEIIREFGISVLLILYIVYSDYKFRETTTKTLLVIENTVDRIDKVLERLEGATNDDK